MEGKPAKSGQIRKFLGGEFIYIIILRIFIFSVLTLILIGYSFLLAVRVKMQKLSIELEKGTKTLNSSDNVGGHLGSKVQKRSVPTNKVMDHPDRVIVKSSSNEIPFQKNSS